MQLILLECSDKQSPGSFSHQTMQVTKGLFVRIYVLITNELQELTVV